MNLRPIIAIAVLMNLMVSFVGMAKNEKIVINIAAIDKKNLFNENGPIRQLIDQHFKHYLPQYSLNYADTNFKKFWADVQQGVDVCHMLASPKIQDVNTIQSNRSTLLIPSPSIVMHKRTTNKPENFIDDNAEAVLNNHLLKGGYNVGRRYPNYLDELIQRKIDSKKSTLFGGHFTINKLHQLTSEGQLDYFIGLPNVMPLISGIAIDDYVVFDFINQSPQQLHIVCNYSEKNKQFVENFDRSAFNWYHSEYFNKLWFLNFPKSDEASIEKLSNYIDKQMR